MAGREILSAAVETPSRVASPAARPAGIGDHDFGVASADDGLDGRDPGTAAVVTISQSTQCATLGLAMGPLRSPLRTPIHEPMPRRRPAPPRPAIAHARVSEAELADWQAKAAAAGVSLSELLRQAMARTQTWTAPAREVERERTRQIARIGSNLNQIARWAHTHVDDDLAVVEVLAHLVAIERDLAQLRVRGAGDAG